MTEMAYRRIDNYMSELRIHLRRLPAEQAKEIVEELRSHVVDSAELAGGLDEEHVREALDRLGSPREIAKLYVTESMAARAQRSFSPVVVLRAMGRFAMMSVTGFFMFLAALVGYLVAITLFVCALVKPFLPHTVGLFRLADEPYSYSLGHVTTPGAHEVLGWAIIPIGYFAGGLLYFGTLRLSRWAIARYRAAHAPSRGFHVENMA